ncbi:MAG: hypothetical protein FWB90_00495 [Fibromonadales bacterium]|nr:hypothetical protein [Fibromonadales bacterium]
MENNLKYLCEKKLSILSILNSQFSILTLIFALNFAYALDPMYEYRYTLGPEILVPDAFHAGTGFYTRRNADGKFIFNFQIGLAQSLETGLKYSIGTKEDWVIAKDKSNHDEEHNFHMIDIGLKYAINPHLTLQADFPVALNKDWDWGGVLTLSQWDGYTKNLSFLSEFRLGFAGAAGEDTYVKPAGAIIPNFQIGESFRVSVGTIASFSFENFGHDFMLDILPKLELGLKWFRLTGEVSIGILTLEAEKRNKYAIFIVSDV